MSQLRLIAASEDFGDADPARVWSLLHRKTRPEDVRLEEIARLPGPGYVPANPALELWQRLCVPARSQGLLLGFLWITDRFGDLTQEQVAEAARTAAEIGALTAAWPRRATVIVTGGELRAFLNVCRHRGGTLCLTDSGDAGRSIRCPYHSWTYRLDGSLMSAPNWRSMASVDKAGYGLRPVALTEWQGLVWLNLAADPAPFGDQVWQQLDYRLGGDRAKFARYDLAGLVAGHRVDYTVAANWKIIQENFQECYHCNTIHPELYLGDCLLRLSIGLEDCGELIADLDQALAS